MIQVVLPFLQLVLAFCNICIMGYMFVKFVGKPHSTLESRVTTLEIEVKEQKQSLLQGNDRFREHDEEFKRQKKRNKAFNTIILSFVNFEVAYCMHTGYEHTEDLTKAKTELEKLLTDEEY